MSALRDVVDDKDVVLGTATKEEIEANGLNCRVAFILLIDSEGRLILQQRAATKRAYPLYWSGAAAGHLIAGETYEQAGHRELLEELGIEAELEYVGKFYSPDDHEWVGVFLGHHDGPYSFDEHEVAAIEKLNLPSLLQNAGGMKFTSFVERSLPLLSGRGGD